MKNLKNLTLALLIIFGFNSCSDDDLSETRNFQTPVNIVQTAQSSDDLSILVEAVIKADLVDALSASGQKTVFAPTNEAFMDFLQLKGFNSLDDVPTDVLQQILLNHVIGDVSITSSSLSGNSGYTNTLATGPNGANLSLYFNATNGVVLNDGVTVTVPDIGTSNGIVHIVNKVIDLPTIATFATTNNALSTLVDALVYADSGMPTVNYIDTVSDSTAGPFTVFAPTNDAFTELLGDLGATSFDDIGTATIDQVLLMHIVSGNIQSSGLPSGSVMTLNESITADNMNFTLTDPNDRVSNIIVSLVDIQAANGVVHVIDKVILPLQS
ncbi:fasciclin domain-containing protein [Aurantibacter sp.]|uniref:fasciclin domain-containing protein n=1 Tax=Aurantibacter sp. TaxID=2807103 RepID=UPI0035C7E098